MLPWPAAPVAFTLVVIAACGLSLYKLAAEWFPPQTASLAACAYMLNPYALFVAYERTAYGELAAGIWLPLIVLYSLRLSKNPALDQTSTDQPVTLNEASSKQREEGTNSKDLQLRRSRRSATIFLSLAIAAIWLTNAPAAVMACYLLAAVAIWKALTQKRWQPILHSASGLILGLGVAAFYLVPADYERRWVEIARVIGPGMRIQDSFLFGHTGESFHDQVLRAASWIFVTMTATIIIAGAITWRKRATCRLPLPIFVATAVLLFLQLPWSAPLWNHAPELRFLQFPWRFALVLSIAFSIAIGAAVPHEAVVRHARAKSSILTILIIASVSFGIWAFWQPCDEEDVVSAQVALFNSGSGFEGSDEYTPVGSDNSLIQQGLPQVRVLKQPGAETAASSDSDYGNPNYTPNLEQQLPAQIQIQQWRPERKSVTIATQSPGYAVLRLVDYAAWQIRLNGITTSTRPRRDDGLIVVPVVAGTSRIEALYTATPDVIWGRALSVTSLLALLALCRPRRRQIN
jgi:hypothetical protein